MLTMRATPKISEKLMASRASMLPVMRPVMMIFIIPRKIRLSKDKGTPFAPLPPLVWEGWGFSGTA